MKKSFVLHLDSLEILDKLKKEQIADLFLALRDYNLCKEIKLDFVLDLVFTPFKKQFERDNISYKNIVQRNTNNGNKPKKAKKASRLLGSQDKPDEAKKADSDSDSVSVRYNVNISVNEKDRLILEFGLEFMNKVFDFYSSYKKEKNYKTKDDNLTIRRWVISAVKDKINKEKNVPQKKEYTSPHHQDLSKMNYDLNPNEV